MTARGLYTLLFGALMLATALSVGSPGAFLLGAAALIATALSLLSVLLLAATLRVTQELGTAQAGRGESCVYTVSARAFALLPAAPVALTISLPSGRTGEYMLPLRFIGETASENRFPCPHVGVYPVGIVRMALTDSLGLFRITRRPAQKPQALTVLPVPQETAPIPFSPGEGESSAAQRAQADRTTPEDTRAWQEGDELGRVHWKLSVRRQKLMVHTYEVPQRPDALVLLDCAAPDAAPVQIPYMIDALTQACAGVLRALLEEGRSTRLPLTGGAPREISGQSAEALPAMLEALAQQDFTGADDFTRALYLASRRMRRTGSTVILTTRLTPALADAAIALSRMGPRTRLVLVSAHPATPAQEKLMLLLISSGVEAVHEQAAMPRRAAEVTR
ncbi:MAG: DUF58 domain-containing protein [Clostridia bacterium]|nr:DUF58 domain-containing protein [Clostridia bacterium]